jgi:hypothetical protein
MRGADGIKSTFAGSRSGEWDEGVKPEMDPKPTSDGHDHAKAVWEWRHKLAMILADAVDRCCRCHEMAPTCFYNGTACATIIHQVTCAGTRQLEQVDSAFQQFSDSLT